MSWTDDEIDALFKEIPTQHRPSPFQDSFFDEIEHLLPQKRSNKGLFWVLGSALVALMTFIYSDATPVKTENAVRKSLGRGFSAEQQLAMNVSEQTPEPSEFNTHSAFSVIHQQKENYRRAHSSTAEETQQPAWKTTGNTTDETASAGMNSDLTSTTSGMKAEDVRITPETPAFTTEENPVENASRIENEKQDETAREEANELVAEHRPQNREFISPSITSGLNLLNAGTFDLEAERQIQALYLPMRSRKHFITLEAGAGFAENFIKMENSSQRPMPMANLGLSYQYRMKQLVLSAGLNWSNFRPNSLELTKESIVYSYTSNRYSQTINYQWMNMVEMPLSIGKRFRNSNVSIGLSPAIMLGSMIDFTKTRNGEIMEQSTFYGNMTGLKRYAATIHLAYDLQIARNLDLGVKVSNMLINPLDESRFVGQLNKNPFQAQLTIKKHFRIK